MEAAGRLTDPMRYDAATDHYLPVPWHAAFAEIGARLRSFDAELDGVLRVGPCGLEAAYMYQLLARLYGTNNLPDCSNMCHETTSVALPESIGVPVGTVMLEDFRMPTRSSSSARTSAATARECCTICRMRGGAACPSSRSIHCMSAGLRRSPIRRAPRRCSRATHTRISTQFHQVKRAATWPPSWACAKR